MKMKLSIFLRHIGYIREQYTQGINKNHRENESNLKHTNDGREKFLLLQNNTENPYA